MLIEEVEWIHTQQELFVQYLQIVTDMLAHQANSLYIGPELETLAKKTVFRQRLSRVQRIKVTTAQAATMFWMNIQSWKHQPFIQQHYPPDLIARMEDGLREFAQTTDRDDEIEWGMRQLALVRV